MKHLKADPAPTGSNDDAPPADDEHAASYLRLDTVNQFSPTTGYVARCRHTRNFGAWRI